MLLYIQKNNEISRKRWINLRAHVWTKNKIFLFCIRDTEFVMFLKYNMFYLFFDRLFGIKSVIQTDCSSTWKIVANPSLKWYHHANPILLLVMYYTLATLIRIWLQEPLVRIKGFCDLVCKVTGKTPGEMVLPYQVPNIVLVAIRWINYSIVVNGLTIL